MRITCKCLQRMEYNPIHLSLDKRILQDKSRHDDLAYSCSAVDKVSIQMPEFHSYKFLDTRIQREIDLFRDNILEY